MVKYNLISFSSGECADHQSEHIDVELDKLSDGNLYLRYFLCADLTQIRIPEAQSPAAAEGLWRHSCFELFAAVEGETSYHEFNFSPSGQWAAYAFSDYRQRKKWTNSQSPVISIVNTNESLILEAVIAAADLPAKIAGKSFQLGLTAVIEAVEGSLSYWALWHPPDGPDFHQRAGFACTLN